MTASFEQWITEQVEAGDLTVGAAVTVLQHGRPLARVDVGSDARGVAVAPDSMFSVRCALVKPALALGLALLVERGEVDLLGTVGDHLDPTTPLVPDVSSIPLRSLLEHTAGLHYTGEIALTVVDPATRRSIATTTAPLAHDLTEEPVLAGAIGGVLLAMIIESATGETFSDFIHRELFHPIGIADDARLCAHGADADDVLDRLLLGLGIDDRRRRPLLLERTRWGLGDWNPGYGGVASVDGLAALYDSALARIVGRTSSLPISEQTLAEFVTRHEPCDRRWWQPVGFGFVRNDSAEPIRFLPPRTFGFSGNRTAFATVSPEDDVVVAGCFIGRHSSDTTLSEMREQRTAELALDLVRT